MSAMRRMGPSYDSSEEGASARAIQLALREAGLDRAVNGPTLELQREAERPPRLEAATPIEGSSLSTREILEAPLVGFGAFLDGIQRSTVRAYRDGVPIVHGAVAAAIRVRDVKRMQVWERPLRSHACYLPAAALDAGIVDALRARCPVVDTLADHEPGTPVPRHPGDLAARALTAVQRDREAAEGTLAEAWTARGTSPLLMDGGISGRESVARSAKVVGAVKSHRTLYVAGDSPGLIFGLREGERTTAVAIASPRRTPVATWYLRLRDPGSRGPFFGLVRVEVAREGDATITARADLVSRWLLAERTPVALPDARWDVMVYGIRECERYLSAILP